MLLRKIQKAGVYKSIRLHGENRNLDTGLIIDCRGKIIIEELDVSNVFIPMIIMPDSNVEIIKGNYSGFGGDGCNIRSSLVHIHEWIGRDCTPTRPYDKLMRENYETISECLLRHGEKVYDDSLLSFKTSEDGSQYIEGYHVDSVAQLYAFKNGRVDQEGVTRNVHIDYIDCEASGNVQGIMASEGSGLINCSFGTSRLRIVNTTHPYPITINTGSNIVVGNKYDVELSESAKFRVANVKPTKYASGKITAFGVETIGLEENRGNEMFNAKNEYPQILEMPRGYRNNNPGNIKDFDIGWKGLATKEQRIDFQLSENVMCVFVHPKWGIRAMAHDLQTKQRKYSDCKSTRGMLERYAPAGKENPALEEYIHYVSRKIGVSHNDVISVKDYDTCLRMVVAMMMFENGRTMPYSDDIVEEGLLLAGIAIPDEQGVINIKPSHKSKGMRNGIIVGGSAIGGIVTKGADISDKVSQTHVIADATGQAIDATVAYSPILVTHFDWIQLGLMAIIAIAALDWLLDRRLTRLLGVK